VLNHNLKSVPLVLTGDKALASFGKVAVGGSFGESNRDLATTESAAGNTLVHKNASCIGQVRCSLTDQVMLPSEYAHAMSKRYEQGAWRQKGGKQQQHRPGRDPVLLIAGPLRGGCRSGVWGSVQPPGTPFPPSGAGVAAFGIRAILQAV
jgi:hypothetical protein